MRVPRVGAAKARTYRLRAVTRTIRQGSSATVRLKLSKAARRAISRALKARKRVTATVRITVADTRANQRTLTRQIRLRR